MKENELNFFASNEREKEVYDSLLCGIQVNNCSGEIIYGNPAYHRMLGFDEGNLQGKKIWELLTTDEDRVSLQEYFGTVIKEQPNPSPYRCDCRRKNGTTVKLQINWNYMRDADGKTRGFLCAITDISESSPTKEVRHHPSMALSALVGVSQRLAATLDLESVLQATVDGATRIAGQETAAVYLLDDGNLVLKATAPALPQDFPDALRSAPLSEHPHIARAIKTGSPLVVSNFAEETLTPAERIAVEVRGLKSALYVPLVVDRSALGAFIVASMSEPTTLSDNAIDLSTTLSQLSALAVRNAQLFESARSSAAELEASLLRRAEAENERKVLQEQFNHAQKMESVGRLAGGVAHDFNNMLSVILGHADLALLELDPSKKIYEVLAQIRNAAQRSADLTRQLLAFARKQVISPRVLDLNSTIGPMIKMLRRLIGEDIDLDWNPGKDIDLVKIDPAQIDQVLANLCVNARDAISGLGKVTIETANAEFDDEYCRDHPGYSPGSYVMVSVSDDGSGMNRETVASIFEPFFSTKEAGEGTGLGLSTVYGIVKQNQGFINVYSEPEQGTTFKFYLPKEQSGAIDRKAEKSFEVSVRGSETVLVVEDEPMILKLCQRMLESLGYHVLVANSPVESIEIAEASDSSIDLLLSDVVMPEMNGPDLAEQLNVKFPGIKVLYMSGYTANVIVHHGILDSSIVLISKPFSQHELSIKVREALEGTSKI